MRNVAAILAISFWCATSGQAQTWTGGGIDDNWSTQANWSGVVPFSSPTTRLLFPLNASRRFPVVDFYAPWALNRMELYGAYSFTGNALSFQGAAPVINGGSLPTTGGPISFANDIIIPGESLTIEGNGQTPIIFSGQISGGGGITTRVPITLSGNNTLTGPIIATTSVSAAPYAIIRVTNPAALGPAESAPVEVRGDRLELYGGITVVGKAISLGTGFGYNQGLVSSGGANGWTGRIDIFSNSYLKTTSVSDSLTISGPIDGHNQPYLNVHGDGDVIISGPISNLQQALDKHGTGTLTLAGNNTYSASTYITKGVVVLQGGNAIADNAAVLLEVFSPDTATLRLEADETIGQMRGQRSIVDLGKHTLRINQIYDQSYAGTFVGSGKVVKAGPAALQFYTPNSHTGGTVVEAGTLQIREDACLGPASTPTVLNGGTLQWGGPASGALDSKRTITLSGTRATQNNLDANGKTFSIPEQITGSGALTKVGPGTLGLSNPQNNYARGTRILSGAVQFDQPDAIAGSGPNVFIAEGGQAAAGYPLDQFFLQRIDPTSSGVVALTTACSNDLDFGSTQLGNAFLGALGTQDFSGSISPAGGVFRLGGTGGSIRLPRADTIHGPVSLVIGLAREPLGRVVLANDNDLEGGVAVNGGVLEIDQAVLVCAQLNVNTNATLQLSFATTKASRVQVNSGAFLRGCGTINGELVNNGNVEIVCAANLHVTGAITNNGSMALLGGTVLQAEGTFVNNGFLDLLTSPGTTLPAGFINNGTVLFPGDVKIRSIARAQGIFSLRIQSYPNHTYQLQRATSLTSDVWEDVGVKANNPYGSDITLADYAANVPGQFYRVEVY